MKLIKPSFEIWEQPEGINGVYKHIEKAGRVCYKSEDKITEDSAESFVERMTKSKHYAMLEHGTIYLTIMIGSPMYDSNYMSKTDLVIFFKNNPYSRIAESKHYAIADKAPNENIEKHIHKNGPTTVYYITTNLRVIVEKYGSIETNIGNRFEGSYTKLSDFITEPTNNHIRRYTVHFVSDIHFYKDITRHRVMSFAIESTRFCNYIKDKFGGSVSYATPIWIKDEELDEFTKDLETVEQLYFKWINKGWSAQQAAYFLIQGTKADAIMTGFVDDYKHFFDLRALGTTGKPHPTVQELALPLMERFKKLHYIV